MQKTTNSIVRGLKEVAAAAAAIVLVAPAAGFAAAAKPLLRIESRSTSFLHNSVLDTDTFVFNDGLVVRTIRWSEFAGGTAEACSLERFTATASSLEELKAALKASHVGLLEGDCTINTVIDDFGIVDDVTWFGRNDRRNTYRTFNNSSPGTCGGEAAIAAAISALQSTGFSETPIQCPDLETEP